MPNKVICIKCLGDGWITDSGYANMDTSHICYDCNGTGFIDIDKLDVSIEEYEKEYNERYEYIGSKRYKKFKILKR